MRLFLVRHCYQSQIRAVEILTVASSLSQFMIAKSNCSRILLFNLWHQGTLFRISIAKAISRLWHQFSWSKVTVHKLSTQRGKTMAKGAHQIQLTTTNLSRSWWWLSAKIRTTSNVTFRCPRIKRHWPRRAAWWVRDIPYRRALMLIAVRYSISGQKALNLIKTAQLH